jgi:molybdopterin-guanine dinucleotide biosynthesis protein A
MTLSGAVLAGGAGRRMGAVKPLVEVGGLPMGARVAGVLAGAGADPVVLVGAPAAVGTVLGLPVVADRWPGEGPLGGIATAAAWARSRPGVEGVVVVACDQVAVTPVTVAALVEALGNAEGDEGGRPVGAVVRTADGRRHPFPSVWRTAAAADLAALVAAGARRADAAFALGVVSVERPAGELVDLDTPGDVVRHERPDGVPGSGSQEASRPDEHGG